ncbi:hypothetical protein HKD37_01G000681 [Glycine soja]
MDRSWMNESCLSPTYEEGVEQFLQFASEKSRPNENGKPMATPPASPPPPPLSPPPPPAVASYGHAKPHGYYPWPLDHLVEPTIERANGPHKKKLRTYLGIVARYKVDVIYGTWKEVPAEFDIPEASDGKTKKKILQTIRERKWALAADKDNVDDTVCEKYDISKENGPSFVRPTETPRGRYKKAQVIQKQNTAPHVLSHGGYKYLEQKLMPEKTKKKLEEAAQSGSTEAWKMTHTKKTGQMTSEVAKEIAEKIEHASQGSFVPHGREDVLTAAIGRSEHPGRVRAGGADVTIKRIRAADSTNQGPTGGVDHRKSNSAADVILQPDAVPVIHSQGLALPPEPKVCPSASRVGTKGSCVDPSPTDPDTGDSDKCGLYIEENPSRLVALGRVYEGSTVVHNIPLLHGQVKVAVEEVKDVEAPIPVPTDEVILVGQALNTFLAWSKHLVKRLSEQTAMSPAKPPDGPDPQVMWDATVFGVFNEHFPRHLTETSMRAGNSDVYGFLEPQSIQRSGQSQFESESYMKSWMPDNYLKGIINRPVLFFNTFALELLNNINILMFLVFNSALKGLDDTPQPKSKAATRWIVVKYFNDVRPLEVERLKALCIQWAQYYLKNPNRTTGGGALESIKDTTIANGERLSDYIEVRDELFMLGD